MRRKPNPRPPHYRPCPDCARRCTTAPLRLASRALRPPPRILTCVHVCRLEIASPRPRFVCFVGSRTVGEPDNDCTDTPATIAIDALPKRFYKLIHFRLIRREELSLEIP